MSQLVEKNNKKTSSNFVTANYRLSANVNKLTPNTDNFLLSGETRDFLKKIDSLKAGSLYEIKSSLKKIPLEEKLFDATADIKILTSTVGMYLTKKWRDKVFSQIDSLHSFSDWDIDGNPIQKESFQTFLKTIINLKPTTFPALGLADNGFLLAGWYEGNHRLTIEFHPKDIVKWIVSKDLDGEVERANGTTTVSRLKACLLPYNQKSWFNEKDSQSR